MTGGVVTKRRVKLGDLVIYEGRLYVVSAMDEWGFCTIRDGVGKGTPLSRRCSTLEKADFRSICKQGLSGDSK